MVLARYNIFQILHRNIPHCLKFSKCWKAVKSQTRSFAMYDVFVVVVVVASCHTLNIMLKTMIGKIIIFSTNSSYISWHIITLYKTLQDKIIFYIHTRNDMITLTIHRHTCTYVTVRPVDIKSFPLHRHRSKQKCTQQFNLHLNIKVY